MREGKMLYQRTLIITVWLLMLSFPAYADVNRWFSPECCEFSVEFPTQYKPKQTTLNGVLGTGATARVGESASFGAECWPYVKQLPLEQFAQRMEMQARQRGVSVSSVLVDRNSESVEQIVLTGIINAGGQTLHIKIITYIGQRTRLDLTMVDSEITSRAQLEFRNSVRLRK